MRRLSITATACLALALLAGCGSDDKSDSGAASSPPPPPPLATPTATTPDTTSTSTASAGPPVKVSMKDIKFVPESITVKVGQKIEWTNKDTVAHNVTATEPTGLFASDTVNGGGTFEYTPTKAGKIDYVCTIHSGQNGSITVTK